MKDWPATKIDLISTEILIPYARNSRVHSETQVTQLASSIQEWGFTVPILVDEENVLIAGHGRLLAAQKLKLDKVPVMVAKGWTEAQKKSYVIADNKLALNSSWDDEMLEIELINLEQEKFNIELLGFDLDELSKLFKTDNTLDAPSEFDEDDDNIETDKQCPKCGYTWSGG